jgi:periplasmic divalent cation tolerance protein
LNADFLLVVTTCADAEQGRDLATALVRDRLAACEHADECLLLIKTTRDRFAALEQAIKARSSYELPEIIAVEVESGSEEYLRWVESSVQPGCT